MQLKFAITILHWRHLHLSGRKDLRFQNQTSNGCVFPFPLSFLNSLASFKESNKLIFFQNCTVWFLPISVLYCIQDFALFERLWKCDNNISRMLKQFMLATRNKLNLLTPSKNGWRIEKECSRIHENFKKIGGWSNIVKRSITETLMDPVF